MDLFDSINRRKSCRNYTQQPFGEEQLEEIREAINGFELLYLDVPLEYRFVTKAKGIFKVQAPHYLMISGQGKEKESSSPLRLVKRTSLYTAAKMNSSASRSMKSPTPRKIHVFKPYIWRHPA